MNTKERNAVIERLKALSFNHKEFRDGWFWFLQPEDDEGKMRLVKAFGMSENYWDGPPDTVLIQTNENLDKWSYVCEPEFGELTLEEGLEILSELEKDVSKS